MSRWPIGDMMRMRGEGRTIGEIRDWLVEVGQPISTGYVHKLLMASGAPRTYQQVARSGVRHEQWKALRDAGYTLAMIANHYGVSRQAVHDALRRLREAGESATQ